MTLEGSNSNNWSKKLGNRGRLKQAELIKERVEYSEEEVKMIKMIDLRSINVEKVSEVIVERSKFFKKILKNLSKFWHIISPKSYSSEYLCPTFLKNGLKSLNLNSKNARIDP